LISIVDSFVAYLFRLLSLLLWYSSAKDLPRLRRQQQAKDWNKYNVLELRGARLGIVGYGDIGRACATLAAVYGMHIAALRRRPQPDPRCDAVYSNTRENLNRIFAESDYILCSAPLTPETRGMIGAEQFAQCKPDAVFINLGRGPIVDEQALIEALQDGKLKGAALDVFQTEPLPTSSPLWEMDNVLLSPHNMDQTATFMHEATEFFVQENLARFVRGEPLLNRVDPAAGY
jgi:phosphoglycerate dehydrogenase-like enzyme